MSKSTSGKLARDYCERHKSASSRSIASMLMRDAPAVYRDYEHARTMVRSARGENGRHTRAHGKRVPAEKPMKFFMPVSDAKPVVPAALDLQGKGLIISDLHIPYHDQSACDLAVNHAIDAGHTDWLLINGDFLDAYQLSRWEKDPRKRRFSGEIETGREVLKALREVFKRVVYKLGNHEVRYQSYMRAKASELLGVPEFELKSLLKADEIGVEMVEANQVIHLGPVNVIHGHEYTFAISNPVSPARGLFLRAGLSAICSHFHRTTQHSAADIRRNPVSCWSIGCLCELSPEYSPLNSWNHGFALVENDRGNIHVDNRRIEGGKAL